MKKTLKNCSLHGAKANGCYCERYYCEICHKWYSENMFTKDKCREICNTCYEEGK